MARYSHNFVEIYKGIVGFGFERKTDEDTVELYLQKFSDDKLMDVILRRMSDEDLSLLFETISKMLVKYLMEEEYHRLFLKLEKEESSF